MLSRLEGHISAHNLQVSAQSAYKKQHSTETALLKISNDILAGLDIKQCTILASLDLSAAFDTVDHSILQDKLRHEFGIRGNAYLWFESYLQDRTHRVSINGIYSASSFLQCGVPQGSVLGARLYTMYTRALSTVIEKHDVMYHCYADDTQIYVRCDNNASSRTRAIQKLQNCIGDVCKWMTENALQLNQDKTELIVFSSDKTPHAIKMKVGNCDILSKNTVKILGVTLDNQMTLDQHIVTTCKQIYMSIRKIKRIKCYLTDYALRTLIQQTVIVRLDYCNSLYNGLPMKTVRKLQLVQNSAARLISGTPRREHISGTLRELHWLPVSKRCQFKLLVLTFKALHGMLPMYICEMLNWYHPSRALRSSAFPSLVPNRNKTVRYGRRLCDTAAATLWNSLPTSLRCATSVTVFKKHLKTYIF